VYHKLSALHRELKEPEAAVTNADMSAEIAARLSVAHPEEPSYRHLRAKSLIDKGSVLGDVGKQTEALAVFLAARELLEPLVIWYQQGKQENIVKAYEIMRAFGVPVGIGAHRLEPIAFCQREGLAPDYYIKTLHHDRYWSAHPAGKRRFMEMYEPNSPHHDEYHDNMFCHDHQGTIDFMQDVKVPWIAFKVLAENSTPTCSRPSATPATGRLRSCAWLASSN
jgi:hypothetical protein